MGFKITNKNYVPPNPNNLEALTKVKTYTAPTLLGIFGRYEAKKKEVKR